MTREKWLTSREYQMAKGSPVTSWERVKDSVGVMKGTSADAMEDATSAGGRAPPGWEMMPPGTRAKLAEAWSVLQSRRTFGSMILLLRKLLKQPDPRDAESTAAEQREEADAVTELDRTRKAWAAQLADLAPRIGLRALEGVPGEVLALFEEHARAEKEKEKEKTNR